jgi:hypothetical protein
MARSDLLDRTRTLHVERTRAGDTIAFVLSFVANLLSGKWAANVTRAWVIQWIEAVRRQQEIMDDGPVYALLAEIVTFLNAEDDGEKTLLIVAPPPAPAPPPPAPPRPSNEVADSQPQATCCYCGGDALRCPLCQPD